MQLMMISTRTQENAFPQGTLDYYLQLGYPMSEAEYMVDIYQPIEEGTVDYYYLQLGYIRSEAIYMAEIYQSQDKPKDEYPIELTA